MVARIPGCLLVAAGLLALPVSAPAQTSAELDAYWAEVSRTGAEGDFAGYAALYHPDAILVTLRAETSYPIASAFERWKPDFVETAEGRAESSVDFRFTRRLHDETTAHETGIFRHRRAVEGQKPTVSLVHFEALLVKKDGDWLMLMELQKQPATEQEWERIR